MNGAEGHEVASSCANCGKTEELETKLKTCNACKLVKYCDRDCQIAHRSSHKKACRIRAAELHDEALFQQPPKADDCPICFLLLPVVGSGKAFRACCGKIICAGCRYEHELQSSGSPTCPFCRADFPSAKEYIKMMEKRADANDSNAMCNLGVMYLKGYEDLSIMKDLNKGLKLLHSAAELGSALAYNNLGSLFYEGDDGLIKDEMKAKQYFEEGVVGGCIHSRICLGCIDYNNGKFEQAIKHWLIGASCGDIRAVDRIKKAMIDGVATRDHYDQALQSYELYLDEVRSFHRDRAAAYSDEYKYLLEA